MRLTLLASLLSASFLAFPASADTRQIVEVVCGTNCPDSIGAQANLRNYWSALESMGTTDFIGSQFGGMTIDASSLLAAASAAGASELDNWLRTGAASSPGIASDISSLITRGNGIDVSSITGIRSSSRSGGSVEDSLMSISGLSMVPTEVSDATGFGGGGTSSCDSQVDSNLVKASEQYVEGVLKASTEGEYSFSALGGNPVSEGPSGSGMFGSTCIEKFLEGGRDILFKPPQLPDLLSRLNSGFSIPGMGGAGGGSSCGGSNPMETIANGLDPSIFSPGQGGFFPALKGGDEVATNLGSASGIALVRSSSVTADSVSSLF